MNKFILFILIALCLNIWIFGQQPIPFGNKYYVNLGNEWYSCDENGITRYKVITNLISIKFTLNSSEQQRDSLVNQYQLIFERKNKLDYCRYRLPEHADIMHVVACLQSEDIVEIAEVYTYGNLLYTYNNNSIYSLYSNDPLSTNQWYLDKIQIYDAWEIETGKNHIIVAILDSGIEWTHEDLGLGNDFYQNIYLNSGESSWSDPHCLVKSLLTTHFLRRCLSVLLPDIEFSHKEKVSKCPEAKCTEDTGKNQKLSLVIPVASLLFFEFHPQKNLMAPV